MTKEREAERDGSQPETSNATAGNALELGLASGASAEHPEALRFGLDANSAEGRALRRKRVVILGAGITGLVAAYELRRAGHACLVFEARKRAGGKIETVRAGSVVEEIDSKQVCAFDHDRSLYFNTGPTRIPQHHQGIVSYCRELDVPLELWQNDNRSGYFYSAALGGRVRLRAVHTALRGHVAALTSTAILRGALDDVIPAADKPTVMGSLLQLGDLSTDFQFIGSTRGGVEPNTGDTTPARPTAVPSLAAVSRISPFHQFLFHGAEMYEQQASMLQVHGGIDAIPNALSERLGPLLRLDHVVKAIRRTATGARIEIEAHGKCETVEADHVIITIPASVLRTIPNDFAPAINTALNSLHYSSAGKLAFQSSRFWETDDQIYGGLSWTEDDITQCMYPAHDLGRNTGCLVATYIFGDAPGDRFAALSPADRITSSLAQGEKLHPQLRSHVKHGISRSWAKTPYSLGGWSLDAPPPVLQEPDGPFIFAGDYTSYLSGWMEAGVMSAQRAVRHLFARPLARAALSLSAEQAVPETNQRWKALVR